MTTVTIAVVSDVHADESVSDWTHVLTEPPISRPGMQPLSDLCDWAEENDVTADYLLVPGDIANQADGVGLSYAWRRLHGLANQLGAKLLAAPGNHDVVTHSAAADPRAMLKNLLPTFPSGDPGADEDFWRQGWLLVEESDRRILILDSTFAFPSYPEGVDEASDEWKAYKRNIDRGSFPKSIEDELERSFAGSPAKLNIAMLHHHPLEHQLRDYMQDDYGPMHRGGDLVHLLGRHPSMGRWLLLHGHKHIPQLAHATSVTSNGPLVLCAASLGAKIWSPVNTVARNQFHLVSATDEPSPATASLRGTVESFTWGYGEGWIRSERSGAGLPGDGGFGCGEDFRQVCGRIAELMDREGREFIPYDELREAVPQLPFVLPIDFAYLERELEVRGFGFSRDREGRIIQLYRSVVAA